MRFQTEYAIVLSVFSALNIHRGQTFTFGRSENETRRLIPLCHQQGVARQPAGAWASYSTEPVLSRHFHSIFSLLPSASVQMKIQHIKKCTFPSTIHSRIEWFLCISENHSPEINHNRCFPLIINQTFIKLKHSVDPWANRSRTLSLNPFEHWGQVLNNKLQHATQKKRSTAKTFSNRKQSCTSAACGTTLCVSQLLLFNPKPCDSLNIQSDSLRIDRSITNPNTQFTYTKKKSVVLDDMFLV